MSRVVPFANDRLVRSPVFQALAGMFALMLHPAHAQVSSEEEEMSLVFGDTSTVSIATGSQQPLRRAPAVASVITAQDITALGVTDLDDALESVPGMHVSRYQQFYTPRYYIRGIYSDLNPQTLVLQNGMPLTTLLTGNRGLAFGDTPVENVARVEVIRGPGSALHGADAFAGVINIITKSAADIAGTEFGARAGSFGTAYVWGQHGGKLGPLDVAGFVRIGHTDGFKKTVGADAQTAFDRGGLSPPASLAPGSVNTGYDAVDGGVDVEYQGWRVKGGYRLRNNQQSGGGVAAALDPIGRERSERFNADVSWNSSDIARHWGIGVQATYLWYNQKFKTPLQLFPPGAFRIDAAPLPGFPNGMYGAPNTWEQQLRLSVTGTYSGFATHNIRLGLGHQDLDMYRTQEFKNFSQPGGAPPMPIAGGAVIEVAPQDSFLTPHRRQVSYAFVQDEWRFARDWALTSGIRTDFYSDFGHTTNPRAALVWDASLNLTAKVLYGRAFRAPTLSEQHSINNPVFIGNPNLRPETIDTLETAFNWQARPDTSINLSLFRYRMDDIIRPVAIDGTSRKYFNTGSQNGHGLELEASWIASRKLSLHGNYAWQRAIDGATGSHAGVAPSHHLFGRVDWSLAAGWQLGSQVNLVAGRKRQAGDKRTSPTPDYATLDLSLRTDTSAKGWDLAGGIRNVFDARVLEPSPVSELQNDDLPMPGRSFYVQLSYRM